MTGKDTQKPGAWQIFFHSPFIRLEEPKASDLYRGKCYGFAENLFTFPERTGEGSWQNGRRAGSAITPRGKVLRFHGKSVHFPPQHRKRPALEIKALEIKKRPLSRFTVVAPSRIELLSKV